jgi:hypothetical protein
MIAQYEGDALRNRDLRCERLCTLLFTWTCSQCSAQAEVVDEVR